MSVRVPGGGVTQNPFGPQWVGGKPGAESVGEQVQDSLFGRPKPRVLDQDDADCSRIMARLHVYKKKLARLAGDAEADYELLLAAGTIASIDQNGVVYMGRELLLRFPKDYATLVGTLSHEIGHRPKRWAEYKSELPLAREELEDLCRLEETRADFFAGFALAQLKMPCDPLCAFLAAVQIHPHPEYLSADMRAKTIRDGHQAGARRAANLNKFFPELARVTSPLNDLGSG